MQTEAPLKVDLSPEEREFIQQVVNARLLKEMMSLDGWPIFQSIGDGMLERVKNQFLDSEGLSRDALWASQIRLQGIREFWRILKEEIRQRVDMLHQPLSIPDGRLDQSELDGEL